MLLDMIGDQDLVIKRDANSTPWLVDVIWSAAARLGHGSTFSNQLTTIEDDHIPFLRAGVAAADIIDLENPTWHGSGRPRPRQCQEPAGRRRCGGRVHPEIEKRILNTLTVGRVLFLRPGGSIKQDSPYESRPSPGSRVPGVSFTL